MKRVLVIDDDEDIRAMLRIVLSRGGGLDVLEAASGAEGVDLAAKTRPDLILLDWMMPGCDGAGTLALLRGREETRSIRVIFLTAASEEFGKKNDDDPCVLGIVKKPFDPVTIVEELRRLWRGVSHANCGQVGSVPGGGPEESGTEATPDGGRRG